MSVGGFRNPSADGWEAMPETMEVRLICLRFVDRTRNRLRMGVAMSLNDARCCDGIELHALYARRLEIELRLRDNQDHSGFRRELQRDH